MASRCTLLAILLLLPAPSVVQDPGTEVRAVLERGGYQTELPGRRPAPSEASRRFDRTGGGERERPEGDAGGGRPREGTSFELPVVEGPGLVLWVLLGAVLVILVSHAVASARGRHRDVEMDVAPARDAAPHPVAISFPPAGEAGRLAGEGHYGAAIRLLLYHALEALARTGMRIVPSWTSREVLRRSKLPPEIDAALRALVDAEERSLFARRSPELADYQACAAAYRALLAAGGSATDE